MKVEVYCVSLNTCGHLLRKMRLIKFRIGDLQGRSKTSGIVANLHHSFSILKASENRFGGSPPYWTPIFAHQTGAVTKYRQEVHTPGLVDPHNSEHPLANRNREPSACQSRVKITDLTQCISMYCRRIRAEPQYPAKALLEQLGVLDVLLCLSVISCQFVGLKTTGLLTCG